MITESIIDEKIRDIINSNNETDAVETIVLIMKELAVIPQSVDVLGSIDRTIDMVCEERFG